MTGPQPALSDRYLIERELGRGGMATVYLARDVRHDRQVAIKVLEPHIAAAERFLREIRIAARLTHPHVLGVHDSGESGGRLFYVMPYVEGETLRARLARDGALPIADALRLARELADALAYAHAHGVVHRDLKPENVLLSGGHAVVADFGIAKALAAATSEGDARSTLTATGVALGTPAYMAPEQAVADAAMDHRVDLYALGLITYEMLTGSHPFGGRTAQAIAVAHLTEAPAPVRDRRPDAPPALSELVMQLLAKDPAARPQTAQEVVRALDELTTGVSSAVRPRTASRPVQFAIATVVLIIAAAGGYAWWRSSRAHAAVPSGIQTVAVLPFENVSGSHDDEYFSDGLTDELAHALARVPGLRIAGRTSSYAFKGKAVSAQEIGRTLDVRAIVDGSVRHAGNQLRVTTQLVSTTDGKVMWDSVYQSQSGDVFAVQDQFTRAIVSALAPSLGVTAGASVRMDASRGTSDEQAYELYLKGHYDWVQRDSMTRAIDYFHRAIARDPRFARAYAGLAMTYEVLPNFVADPADSLMGYAEAAAAKAIALDSTLADAHLALATVLEVQHLQFRGAQAHYRAAATAEPSNATAHHWWGASLLNLGHTDEAIAELARAKQADPLLKSAASMYANALVFDRRFPEAMTAARYVLSLDSTFHYGLLNLGMAQMFGGQPDSAVVTLDRATRLHPEDPRMWGALLFAYAAAGRWADAERVRQHLRQPGVDDFDGIQSAFADLVFGNREPLVRLLTSDDGLKRFIKAGGVIGCDPFFDPLWSDPRFREKMQSLGIEPCPLVRPWPINRPASVK